MDEITTREVAEIFGVKPFTVLRWTKERSIPFSKPPRDYKRQGYRFKIRDIAAFAATVDEGESSRQLDEWYKKRQRKASAQ